MQQALYRLTPGRARRADRAAPRTAAISRHLVYLRDGAVEPIRVLPAPITVLPDQLAYIHHVTLTMQNALKRLPELYLQDFAVREILRLPDAEEHWLWECWGPSQDENNPVFGRLDAVVDFTSPMWKDSLRFVEPNLSGIGGAAHGARPASSSLAESSCPVLQEQRRRSSSLDVGHDIRELLIQEMLDHLAGDRPPARNVCFIEPKYAGNGPDEQEELARYYRERYGLKIMHADPAELRAAGRRACATTGERVDLAYRDYGVRDLIELEAEGVDVEPMRVLFRQNRIDLVDRRRARPEELLGGAHRPAVQPEVLHADERQVFRRHILWTRVLSDRRTMLPDGGTGDLLEYVRTQHETLVLKPNRAYGGDGIVIGPAVTPTEWEAALQAALADPTTAGSCSSWRRIPVQRVPGGRPRRRGPRRAVLHGDGLRPDEYGLAILARASQKQVVNVAQRGGMCGVLVGHSRPAIGAVPDVLAPVDGVRVVPASGHSSGSSAAGTASQRSSRARTTVATPVASRARGRRASEDRAEAGTAGILGEVGPPTGYPGRRPRCVGPIKPISSAQRPAPFDSRFVDGSRMSRHPTLCRAGTATTKSLQDNNIVAWHWGCP